MPDAAHPFIKLAAEAITTFLSEQRVIAPPAILFDEVPQARDPAGVFVCLKREGILRGCLGTTEPACGTRAAEIVANAIGAATRDPRFPPVEWSEAADLLISVDVLGPCQPVTHLSDLDPRRYGLLLCMGERRSVLLPDIEGIDSVKDQIEAAREKAGISADQTVDMFRFEVERYR
jgi:AmmeMemoRadiSam system protein A